MFVFRGVFFCSADVVQRNFPCAQFYCRPQQASHRHDHAPDNIDIDAFSPPVEQETVAVSRAPEVPFQTFVVFVGGSGPTGTSGIQGGRFSGPAGFVD